MGGFAGGIVAGAMGGLGGAMEKQGEIAQQQQGQYSNAANLAQLNAQLDLQKQASLMDLQRQQKLSYIASLKTAADAEDARNNPQAASVNAPTGAGAPASGTNQLPQMGLDTSQISPSAIAFLKAQDPNAFSQGVANMAVIKASQQAGANTPGDTAIPVDGGLSHSVLTATSTPDVKYPGVASASGQPTTPQGGASGAFWVPPTRLQYQAALVDQNNPGAGLEMIKAAAPDATGHMLLGQGIKPGSPEWVQGYANAQKKAESMSGRQGGFEWAPDGTLLSSTPNAQGIFYTQDPQTKSLIPHQSPGYTNLLANAAGAEAGGKLQGTNPLTIAPEYALPATGDGKKVPVSITGALTNGVNGSGAGLAPGVVVGKEGQQKALTDKWTALNSANQQAQTTNSYLQSIKDLASKAATGPMSDHIDFVNGLISLLPDSLGAKKATDAVAANDLLDKYQNQIVARLGQGGMSTDSARAILSSAYPGAHMNLSAINEAVDNLVGANNMIKAKATLLAPHAANLDPIAYQQNELAFDKAADPRIFQYMNMTPAQQSKYVSEHPDAVKTLKEGRDALTALGVFK